MLETLSNYASALIFILGIFLIYFWNEQGGSKFLTGSIKTIFTFWMLLVGWFLVVPFILVRSGNVNFVEGMYSDYRFLIFSILPFIFISNEANIYYNKIFKAVSIVAIVSGVFSILTVDKTVVDAFERQTVGVPYFLWWVVVCVYPYMFLKSFVSKQKSYGLILFSIHIICSLLFLKRSGITGAFSYFIIILIFSNIGGANKIKIFSGVAVLLLVIVLLFGNYLEPLYARFEKDASDIENFDRLTELDEFFSGVTTFQILSGFGANNYMKMYYIGEFDNEVRALHIGFYNILYKGGILYLFFTIFLAYQILKLFPYIKRDNEILIGFVMGVYFILSYSFENSWSYIPYHFFKLLPIYRAIYLKDLLKSDLPKPSFVSL
ncbi:MAG: hypothetical protein L6Q78_13275 [Bacteroidia bacterium]|nr:hypothetical protein [Bacteroidia bacterium]